MEGRGKEVAGMTAQEGRVGVGKCNDRLTMDVLPRGITRGQERPGSGGVGGAFIHLDDSAFAAGQSRS